MVLRLFANSKIVRDLIEMASTGTLTGSSLIVQVQIAIVGIIIVLGVFFIWRAVSRIEQRLNIVEINQKTLSQCTNNIGSSKGGSIPINTPVTTNTSGTCAFNPNPNIQTFSTAAEFTEIDEFADEMIKVFSEDTNEYSEEDLEPHSTETPETDPSKATTTATNIVITPVQVPQTKRTASVIDEVLSEADTEPGNPLSKSKLKGMNVEKLKAICTHHKLSTEGSKNVLISRILGEFRD